MRPPESDLSDRLLLDAVTGVLSQYITETDPYVLFNGLLDALLGITASEYGFIGEVFHADDGSPYVKSYATTDIAWSADTRRLYDENERKGMVFSRLDSLYGAVLKTGQRVIANRPAADPRACGLPKGHPPLHAFLGMPFYGGGNLLGMVGLANRKGGYHRTLAESLHPFLTTCGNLILAYRSNRRHELVEAELRRYKARTQADGQRVALGAGYEFDPSRPGLDRNASPVILSRKELRLLEVLAANVGRPVSAQVIEDHVWRDVVVGESSLRSLVRRLRKSAPDLSIKTVPGVGYLLAAE